MYTAKTIEQLYDRITSATINGYWYVTTITFDLKNKKNIKQVWDMIYEDLSLFLPQGLIPKNYVLVVEYHKNKNGKADKTRPHLHGLVQYSTDIEDTTDQYGKTIIETLRNNNRLKFGRFQLQKLLPKNYNPPHLEGSSNDWIEYMLKDVVANQNDYFQILQTTL